MRWSVCGGAVGVASRPTEMTPPCPGGASASRDELRLATTAGVSRRYCGRCLGDRRGAGVCGGGDLPGGPARNLPSHHPSEGPEPCPTAPPGRTACPPAPPDKEHTPFLVLVFPQ